MRMSAVAFLLITSSAFLLCGCRGDDAGQADGGATGGDGGTDTDIDADTDTDTDTNSQDDKYQWHSFFGNDERFGSAITADGEGSIYVTGGSNIAWDGPDGQSPLAAFPGYGPGGAAIFVLKLDSLGAYQWHTFLGTQDYFNAGYSVATDSAGNVYVTGYGPAWNGPNGEGPINDCPQCASTIFAAKLDTDGEYQWHTLFGSQEGYNWGSSIEIDSSNNVFVAGSSTAPWNGPDDQSPLHDHAEDYEYASNCAMGFCADIMVLKLTSSGEYQWHTFWGAGDSDDFCQSSKLDKDGNVHVGGYSADTWSGPDGQAPLNEHSDGEDIAVLKLNADGAYQWHAFFGAEDHDGGYSIDVDGDGNVSITGKSDNSWDGPNGESPLNEYNRWEDIFVLQLGSSGAYRWHTFFGGSTDDVGTAHALDENGNIYVTGSSMFVWEGPDGQEALNPHSGATNDIFVLKLKPDGAYDWHSFYGGGDTDVGYSIVVDKNKNIFATGLSYELWNGPEGQGPLNSYQGYHNIFVLKLID